MKKALLWATGLLTACASIVLAQSQPQPMPIPAANRTPGTALPQQPAGELTRFSLNFPGGMPKDLVAAIQQALGRPLNAIVPDEYAQTKLPALRMTNVNVQQLFSALEQASRKTQAYESGSYYGGGQYGGYRSIQQVTTSYGFQQGPGPLTDETIWCFHAEKPPMPTLGGTSEGKAIRFYSLASYLHPVSGAPQLTVDDITTAIETGWKMLDETSPPKISFHKDTNLLIAVGEPNKLEMIDAVLKALAPPAPSPAPGKAAAPKPAESPRSAESTKAGGE